MKDKLENKKIANTELDNVNGAGSLCGNKKGWDITCHKCGAIYKHYDYADGNKAFAEFKNISPAPSCQNIVNGQRCGHKKFYAHATS